MVASLQKRELFARRARTKDPFRASHLIPFIRQAWPWRLPVGVANREGRTVSSLTDASSSSLLSPEALSVVQASAPVVAAQAD